MDTNRKRYIAKSHLGYEQTDGGRQKVTFAFGLGPLEGILVLVKGHVSEDSFRNASFFTVRIIGRVRAEVSSTRKHYLLWPHMEDPFDTRPSITPRVLRVVDIKEIDS